MQTSSSIGWLFGIGLLLLLGAIVCQTITLASGEYAAVLITALTLTALADGCFIQTLRCGGLMLRCLSTILLLPTLFVVADFIQRVPYLFH